MRGGAELDASASARSLRGIGGVLRPQALGHQVAGIGGSVTGRAGKPRARKSC
jgi:hypothetical protein